MATDALPAAPENPIFDRARQFIRKNVVVDIEHMNAEDWATILVMFALDERIAAIRECNAEFVEQMHRRANRDREKPAAE